MLYVQPKFYRSMRRTAVRRVVAAFEMFCARVLDLAYPRPLMNRINLTRPFSSALSILMQQPYLRVFGTFEILSPRNQNYGQH